MSLSAKVGSFNLSTASGNQGVNVGFQPSLVFFFPTRVTSDTSFAGSRTSFGAASSSSSQISVCYSTTDATGAASVRSVHANDRCIIMRQSAAGVYDYNTNFSSTSATGFTIGIVSTPSTGYVINYVALGGSDITNVKADAFARITTATGIQNVTGIGFKPDNLILTAIVNSSTTGPGLSAFTGGVFGFGISNGITNGSIGGFSSNNVNPSVSARRARIDKSFIQPATSAELTVSSFDSDGFTLDWTQNASLTAAYVYYITTKGMNVVQGTLTSESSTGTIAYGTPGITPKVIILFGKNGSASTINSSDFMDIIGATDGTNQFMVNNYDQNGVSPTVATHTLDRTLVYKSISGNTSASINSFQNGGFKLNWTVASAESHQIFYWAVGDQSTNGNFLSFM